MYGRGKRSAQNLGSEPRGLPPPEARNESVEFWILEMAVACNRTELHNIIAGVGDTAGRILVGIKGGIQF